ncbi:hypothetical protein H0H92_005765 [Tricholoma furcatifolium]|nr:hypothetical protein H0H92_005765 [Tricholoma furcatifolium]
MYNGGYGGSAVTNNPFVTDPTNAHSRFPDISTSPQSQWPPPPLNANVGYQQPQGMYQQPSFQQQPPLSPSYSQPSGHLSPHLSQVQAPQPTGLPFQPTSSFGQQLAANISGTSYGYLQGQNGSSQHAYTPAQQQLQSPGYLAQFDPYSSIGQGWSGETQVKSPVSTNQNFSLQVQSPIPGATPAITSITPSPGGQLHPREYLRVHKGEIEAWDSYAWKQLLTTIDALKQSWEGRVKELEGRATQLQRELQTGVGNYLPTQVQQEGIRLQGMEEVFQGYRQSADVASKRRVREASNAAIQALPDWPPVLY